MLSIALIKQRLSLYERLMRLDKPIGILLLLWPTLWGLWIASEGQPNWMIVWIFVFGTVLMRSAGCAINDYADRNIDPHVERTKNRPLALGLLAPREALILAAVLAFCAFLLIVPLLTLQLFALALAALFLAASYPFTKRFFAMPQAYLGVAFAFGIPMAFEVNLGFVPQSAWLLVAANVFWAIAYDTEYALVDIDDDLRIGIKTAAITFGRHTVAAIMLCYAICFALLAYFGWQHGYGLVYLAGIVVAVAISVYHYTLIRQRERMRCFKAFLHNNWIGAAIFAGIVLENLLAR